MQLEPMLAQCVLPLFKSPYGFVRAKACWVAGLFADIGFREGQSPTGTFVQLFQEVFHLLRDPELPVSFQIIGHVMAADVEQQYMFRHSSGWG